MNELPKLMDSSPSELSRALLRAGQDERPSADAMGRTLAAVGAGAIVAGATGAASASAAVASKLWAMKWGLAALVSLTALAGGGYAWNHAHGKKTSARPVAEVTPAGSPQGVVAGPALVTSAPEAIYPAQVDEPIGAPPASANAAPVAIRSSASSLDAEIAAISAAKAALAAGDTTKCLWALDRYQRDYPRGSFAHEVVVLRIEALEKRGDQAGARALAKAFLAAHPTSPYAARIRSLVKDQAVP